MQLLENTGREERSLNAFRQDFEQFSKMQNSAQAAGEPREEPVAYVPTAYEKEPEYHVDRRPQKPDLTPYQYAYNKYRALLQAGNRFSANAEKSLGRILKAPAAKVESEAKHPSYYKRWIDPNKPHFVPTADYIYTPKKQHSGVLVNQQAAQIGYTAFMPLCDANCRTKWAQNWNDTQYNNDYNKRNRATCGFENLANQYVLSDNIVVDCGTGKFLDAETHNATTNAIHRYLDINAVSQTRAYLVENNQAAFEIAQNDKQRAHAKWLADKAKPSPIGLDMPRKVVSHTQFAETQLRRDTTVAEQQEREIVLYKAKKAAWQLFGKTDEVDRWVDGLNAIRVKQLAGVAEKAMQSGVIADDCRKEVSAWFYMNK